MRDSRPRCVQNGRIGMKRALKGAAKAGKYTLRRLASDAAGGGATLVCTFQRPARWACKSLAKGVCERRRAFARPVGREKCEKCLFRTAVGRA